MVDFKEAKFTGGTVDFYHAAFTGGEVDFRSAQFTGGGVTFGGRPVHRRHGRLPWRRRVVASAGVRLGVHATRSPLPLSG
jgi:Pentapeptide repeats (9 copies)